MLMVRRWFNVSLLIVGLVGVGSSQSPSSQFSISGVVQDPNGAVITGAQVDLRNGNLKIQSTITDRLGAFAFSKVPRGSYEIQVQSEGFELANAQVQVGSKAPVPLQITLAVRGVRQESTITANSDRISSDTAENQNS